MKFTIVLLLAVFSVALAIELTEEQKTMIRVNVDQCIQEQGITKDQAIALHNDSLENVDDQVKCFANCYLEKFSFIADGQMNKDEVLKITTPLAGADKANAFVTSCEGIKGADKCDTGFQIYQCFKKNRLTLM
ncbi:general odorant-binding protein 56d [Drosophila grimshawi]|uniref:GH23017 n=1 Tax=Drosophila grimshawi TaxID=7222 RepID=B4JWD3_DROGR|nr:general odorant-binding protein 56d [Drosophila grimshawi]EDV98271.1 GH23017 [Drosophila grimshawi]